MKKPAITDEKLKRIMQCLVAEFEESNHSQVNKLSSYAFYLTERMTCAKEAGLNYTTQLTEKSENSIKLVQKSEYVSAIETLASMGYVEKSETNKLIFHITQKGFNETKHDQAIKNYSKFEKILIFCSDNPNFIKIVATIVAGIFSIIAAIISFKSNNT